MLLKRHVIRMLASSEDLLPLRMFISNWGREVRMRHTIGKFQHNVSRFFAGKNDRDLGSGIALLGQRLVGLFLDRALNSEDFFRQRRNLCSISESVNQ